jgi:hypothetical protein
MPAAPPQRSKPQQKPKEKPWWAQLVNAAEYERRQLTSNPVGRLLTLSGARRFANDVQYEVKQLSDPRTALPRLAQLGPNYINPVSGSRAAPIAVTAAADAARNGIEAYQRLMGAKRGDYANTPLGKFIDYTEDANYRSFGMTPRQEQQGLERFGTELGAQAVAGGVALATGSAVLGAASKAPVIGRAAAGLENLMNPLAGRTAAGKVVRAALAGAYEEGITTPFVDNTGGSAAGMVNYLLGREVMPDPAAAGADRVDAAGAAIVPNTLMGAAMGGAGAALFGGIARGRRAATEASRRASQRKWMESNGIQEVDPETGAARFTEQVTQSKPEAVPAPANFADAEQRFMEKYGIPADPQGAAPAEAPQAPPPSSPAPGGIQFVDPWTNDWRAYANPYPWPLDQPNPRMDPRVDPWQLPPDLPPEAGFAKAQPGELPEFDPAADPWAVEYDPSLPEASDLGQLIDELDDAELAQVAANADMPVLQQVQEILQNREQPGINPDLRWDLVSAPRESIADDYLTRYEGRVRSLDYAPLRDLAANSPEVSAKVTELTGKTISEFTKADIVDGVLAIGDRVLLANRMTGGQLFPTNDLAVRPEVYQYKADTNADGVQLGKQFGKWDPDAEGIIETRVNPEEGTVDVVNGHHRKSQATALGIPSMRVMYQQAIDAADARRQGAISNISAGAGTVWDAAKFIKESPDLQDLASLKAAGKTSKGGLWKEGLALSRLPDDLFKAAQDGVIDAKYAVMIGDSGLDPEKMSKLFGVAAKGPSVDEFTARMLIARQAPAGEVSQANLFGDTTEDLSDELAKVFASVKRDLTDDKNTFGRLSRKSTKIQGRTDSKIDVKGSISVSEEAKSALRYFEQSWLTDPEITALMNKGALELRNGVPAQAVAGQIKQVLPEILQRRMAGDMGGAEAPAAVPGADNPDQGGLFGAEQATPQPAADSIEARWAAWSPTKQDEEALKAKAAVLSDKQVANRQAKAEVLKAREAEAMAATDMTPEQFAAQYPEAQAFLDAEAQIRAELLADPKNVARTKKGSEAGLNRAGNKAFEERIKALGQYPGPVAPKTAEMKPVRELEAHDDAVRYLEWYDSYVTQRELTPADQDARKAALIARAAQGGEIRPDETPIPEVIADEGIDVNAAAREAQQLLDEGAIDLTDDDLATKAPNLLKAAEEDLRLRQLQAEQDAEVSRAVLEAQREAEGYQDKTFDERRKEVAAGFEETPPEVGDMQSIKQFDWNAIQDQRAEPYMKKALALALIRRVAGEGVIVRFNDVYEREIKSAQWGGDGKEMTDILGWYRLKEDLIQVNAVTQEPLDNILETAYHEAWHRLQYLSLSAKEIKVLDSAFARMKVGVGANRLREGQVPISYFESQALAFQRYAYAKMSGMDPVAALFGNYEPNTPLYEKALNTIVSAFDVILDFTEKMYNLFANQTFDSTRAIFDRAQQGALADIDWAGVAGELSTDAERLMLKKWAENSTWMEELSNFKKSGYQQSIGPSDGAIVDRLNRALGDEDPRTGMNRQVSRAATKQAMRGNPMPALTELTDLTQKRLADIETRLAAIQQTALNGGCSL